MIKQSCWMLALLTIGTVQAQNKQAEKFAKTIQASELKEKLTIVAGDEMEGRETGTEGQRKAALYIEEHFKTIGLLPGNKGSYQMHYPVYQDVLHSATASLYNLPFNLNEHFALSVGGAANGSFSINEIYYAGHAGAKLEVSADVAGKWVLVAEQAFGGNASAKPAPGANNMRQIMANIQPIMAKKPKGVLIISNDFPRKAGSSVGNMYVSRADANSTAPLVASVSYQFASSLLSRVFTSYEAVAKLPVGLYKTQANLTVNKETKTLSSSNVIGMIEGTDKKDEYIFLTAHYDHLGKRDGVIYYGADDDGSGTVSIMEIAEAFAAAAKRGERPRRTIVFMAVSGEEKGLWGSDYYARNPIFPLAKTSVDLNIDMVGRIDPSYKGDSLNYVFTIGEDKLSSDLQPISDSINKTYGLNMELDRRYNDPNDRNRFYYRSDHYNFAKNGVPVIFYFNGVHADYHRPSDTVDKINFELMRKRVVLVYYTAWAMANRDNMLVRDKPLNMPPR